MNFNLLERRKFGKNGPVKVWSVSVMAALSMSKSLSLNFCSHVLSNSNTLGSCVVSLKFD